MWPSPTLLLSEDALKPFFVRSRFSIKFIHQYCSFIGYLIASIDQLITCITGLIIKDTTEYLNLNSDRRTLLEMCFNIKFCIIMMYVVATCSSISFLVTWRYQKKNHNIFHISQSRSYERSALVAKLCLNYNGITKDLPGIDIFSVPFNNNNKKKHLNNIFLYLYFLFVISSFFISCLFIDII